MATDDVPKIVLEPHERSHPFAKRECVVQEALKVGRSVDRRRISQNNLIFDCRVLSRNHALIWFEDGKFYIKDTKSSNGTFVNENRLSPSAVESEAVELKSKDILQFGVNVNVEKKVTHGCIIATIKLVVNDVELPGRLDPPIQQVMQIVQNALSREQELENKLASMQDVINSARELANESMIAIVKEDELMSRLEMLENQLQVYSRSAPEDDLKKQLAKAFEEKHKNEQTSKDSLRAILQEKLECAAKLSQLQRDYDKAEQECQRYKTLYDAANEDHSSEVGRLSEQLKGLEKEKKLLEEQMMEEKQTLQASLESLQAEADFTKQQLKGTRARLEETQDELFQVKVKAEADRQRKLLGMPPIETSDSLELSQGDSFVPIPEELPEENEEPSAVTEVVADQVVQSELEGAPAAAGTGPTDNSSNSEVGMDQKTEKKGPLGSLGRQQTVLSSLTKSALGIPGKVNELQRSLSQSEEDVKSLQTRLQLELKSNRSLQESITAMGGQLNQCLKDIEEKHAQILHIRGELARRERALQELEGELARSHDECKSLHQANSALEGELRSLREQYHHSLQEEQRAKEENSDLSSRLRDIQSLLDEQSMATKSTAHFLERPGCFLVPQRANFFMVVAVIAIGVAVLSWLV